MNVRRAAEADEAILRELWDEFEVEVPEPSGFTPETWEQEWRDTREDIATGAVFIAEDDTGPVGVARLQKPEYGASHLQLLYVRPRARREGVAKALLRACVEVGREHGSGMLSLEVLLSNEIGRAVWHRLGFSDLWVGMAQPVDERNRGARFTQRYGMQPEQGRARFCRVPAKTLAHVLAISGLASTSPQQAQRQQWEREMPEQRVESAHLR